VGDAKGGYLPAARLRHLQAANRIALSPAPVTMPDPHTLLVALAHPDDELGVAGTILSQVARGDRVVLLWLTRGEMTEAYGPLPVEEVARRRVAAGERAAEVLGAEARFLDLPDTRLVHEPEAVDRVAQVIAEVRPDGIVTWGDGWTRGMRHPDHQACGRIVRDAVTIARIRKRVRQGEPYRGEAPVFTLRDVHSALPAVAIDVSAHRDAIHRVAQVYFDEVGFGDPEWLDRRLAAAGARWGVAQAEELDAWETDGGLCPALLPARAALFDQHPDRRRS
jgi:N-acetylglucosamine malate deacetylase 1